MQSQRLWVAGTIGWLFLLFNIERIYEPIDMASFVYALCAALGVLVLSTRKLRDLPMAWVLIGALSAFVVGKCTLGYSIGLAALPTTALEVVAIACTLFLTTKIGRHTDEFARSTAQLLQIIRGREIPDFQQAEEGLQLELARARRHERPLTFVAMSADTDAEVPLADLVHNLQQILGKEYLLGNVGDLLLRETKSHDRVVRIEDRFLMLLPETTPEQAAMMVGRLNRESGSQMGVQLMAEVLRFPDQENTLAGILDRMHSSRLQNVAALVSSPDALTQTLQQMNLVDETSTTAADAEDASVVAGLNS